MAEERKSRFERKEKPSPFGPGPGWSVDALVKGIGVATGLGAGVYWLSRIQQSQEGERLEAKRWQHEQNAAWKQRQSSETARGRGAFKHMFNSADPAAMNAWEEFHQRAAAREAASAAAAPAGGTAETGAPSGGAKPAEPWAEFDARMKTREAATEAEAWAKYPDAMAEQARERAAATGEPIDPRAQRGLVRRGFAGVESLKNPNAIESGPGVDIEGMKRVFPPREGGAWGARMRSFGGKAGRAAGWIGAALAAYGVYRGMEKRGGVSWANAPGAVGDEALNQLEGTGSAVSHFSSDPITPLATELSERLGGPSWLFGGTKLQNWALKQGVENIRTIAGWFTGGSGSASSPNSPAGESGTAFASEEEARRSYSEDAPDERMPAAGGLVPIGPVTINPDAGKYRNGRGWEDSGPRKKRGKPFKDPHGIGQARLQAEHDIDEQNALDARGARQRSRDEKKAADYIAYIDREDRKRERARLASEHRQIDYENSSAYLGQLAQWERERIEGRGRRRHHSSISANAWQAAGATVGGFSQINVELMRSEIERALERGETEIRMN